MIPKAANQATGLQRAEGSLPSGNNKSRKVVGTITRGVHAHELNQAAVCARLLEPQPLASQNSAKPLVRVSRPSTSPTPQNIQPIALRGWREAMMAPTTEKVSTVAKPKTME